MEVANKIVKTLGFYPSTFYLKQISDPFALALINLPIIIILCDLDFRYTWIFNSQPDFDTQHWIGKK
jgi:hypothetical protein